MASYSYDENGAFFNYFLLSILALILFPMTFIRGKKKYNSNAEVLIPQDSVKITRLIKKHQKPLISTRNILLALGWVLFAFVTYKASTTIIEEQRWDPYEILGITTSANATDIKKAFRKLSLKYHPDKVVESEKEASSKIFVDISKAHKVLTDEEARKTFDEFGHPDGKQSFSLGIALPLWLVEKKNSMLVLLIYTLLFGIGLPLWVARWWYNSKNFTKDKIMNVSMARFYQDLKDSSTFKGMVELLSSAEEFSSLNLDLDPNFVLLVKNSYKEKNGYILEKSKKYAQFAWSYKVTLLFYAHIYRLSLDGKLKEEQEFVIEKFIHLCSGLLQISMSHNWLSVAVSVIQLEQYIVQALFEKQSPILQIPYIDEDILKHFKGKKRNVTSIRELLLLEEEERRLLLRTLSDEHYNAALKVAKRIPILHIRDAYFGVIGYPHIYPGSLVTLRVNLELLSYEKLLAGHREKTLTTNFSKPKLDEAGYDQEVAPPPKTWWKNNDGGTAYTYCPYYPNEKKSTWWVIMADAKNNRLVAMNKVTNLKTKETSLLQFQAPNSPGQWNFQIIIKSDGYLGNDYRTDLRLIVEAPPKDEVIQEIEIVDSSDEEEELAMTERPEKGQYDDSSEDDDYEEEGHMDSPNDFVE